MATLLASRYSTLIYCDEIEAEEEGGRRLSLQLVCFPVRDNS